MKKTLTLIIALTLILVGGHAFVWHRAVTHAQKLFDFQIANLKTRLAASDIQSEITYQSTPAGYPLSAGLNLQNIDIALKQNGQSLGEISLTGDITLTAGIWQPKQLNSTAQNISAKIDAWNQRAEKKTFFVTLDDITTEIDTQGTYEHITLNGLDVAIQSGAGRDAALTIDNLETHVRRTNINPQQHNVENSMIINGLTLPPSPVVFKPKELHLEHLKVNFHAQAWPAGKINTQLRDALHIGPNDTVLDTREAKKILARYFEQMAEYKSQLTLKELSVKGPEVDVRANGSLTLDADTSLAGEITLNLGDVKGISPEMGAMKDNPLLLNMQEEGETLNTRINLKAQQGRLWVNGLPIIPLPPLKNLLLLLPDELQRSQEEAQMPEAPTPQNLPEGQLPY